MLHYEQAFIILVNFLFPTDGRAPLEIYRGTPEVLKNYKLCN